MFAQPPLSYLTLLGCVAMALFLNRTQAELILRATGENPDAVFASGANPMAMRMLAVVACGAMAGIGGAMLSLQQVGIFTDGMTGGRGYLALAALIVGRWTPWDAAAACLVLGPPKRWNCACRPSGCWPAPMWCTMAPYVIALAVLAGIGRSSKLPAAIGQPLQRT